MPRHTKPSVKTRVEARAPDILTMANSVESEYTSDADVLKRSGRPKFTSIKRGNTMRKIEKQMIEAIRSGDNWKSANTEVKHSIKQGIHYADVYLHGHHIAVATPKSWDVYPVAKANRDTFREWPTATTRSRLRALGINASIRNFQACLDGMTL